MHYPEATQYASPLVLVWKKDGSLHICTDFRWLNAKTVKDAHPLPHQADTLAALGGNVFFYTMVFWILQRATS